MGTDLKEYVDASLKEIKLQQQGLVNDMLKPSAVSADADNMTISLAFEVLPWEANKVGGIHGGIIATIADMTAGVMARYCAGENFAPTASLDIRYVRPASVGDELVATAKLVNAGRRLIQQNIEIVNRKTGKVVATGSCMHLNADTDKERKQEGK